MKEFYYKTILFSRNKLSGIITLHPRRPLSDGTFSDARVLTILELLRITGLPDNYPIPDWAKEDENLIRAVIGECFAPLHVQRMLTTLPINKTTI